MKIGVTQGLHRSAQLSPNGVATICEDRTKTHRELYVSVGKLAGAFSRTGFREEVPIAMLGLNSDFYLAYYLACAWGNYWVNPVNFRWSIEEVVYSLNDSGSQAIILDKHFSHYADAIVERCPHIEKVLFIDGCPGSQEKFQALEALLDAAEPINDRGVSGESIFGVFYTGGTTGFPKGVMLSHSSVLSSAMALLAEGVFPRGTRALHAAPMFHLADTLQTMCVLLRGGSHVMLPQFSPSNCIETVHAHSVTDMLVVPTMLQMIVDSPDFDPLKLASLRRVVYGGSPFQRSVLLRTMEKLPDVSINQGYGMTESSGYISFLSNAEHRSSLTDIDLLGSAGKPGVNVGVKVLDKRGEALPTGDVGEIAFRSPGLMCGYFDKPDATSDVVEDSWMRTGDLGYLSDSGYLFIVDRAKDMIISGGENIYSAEVETVVSLHPDVMSSAVIGVPDDEWGEAVHAVIVLADDAELTIEELSSHCRKHLAGYKCPKTMSVTPQLPLSGAGKVKKTVLREQYLESIS